MGGMPGTDGQDEAEGKSECIGLWRGGKERTAEGGGDLKGFRVGLREDGRGLRMSHACGILHDGDCAWHEMGAIPAAAGWGGLCRGLMVDRGGPGGPRRGDVSAVNVAEDGKSLLASLKMPEDAQQLARREGSVTHDCGNGAYGALCVLPVPAGRGEGEGEVDRERASSVPVRLRSCRSSARPWAPTLPPRPGFGEDCALLEATSLAG